MIEFASRAKQCVYGRILLHVLPKQQASLAGTLSRSGFAVRVLEDWSACEQELASEAAPDVWVIAAELVDEAGVATIRKLHGRNQLTKTVVLFGDPTRGVVMEAWPLAVLGAHLFFADDSLPRALIELLHTDVREYTNYLAHRRDSDPAGLKALLLAVACDQHTVRLPVDEVAAGVQMSRAELYREFGRYGLPGVAEVQFLLRLLPAMRAFHLSGNADRAARLAGLADATTFRRSVKKRFGLELGVVRKSAGWRVWIEHWISRNCTNAHAPRRYARRPALRRERAAVFA